MPLRPRLLDKIATLELQAGPPQDLTLWIVAVDPQIKFVDSGSTVGFVINASDGHRAKGSEPLDNIHHGSGEAILETLTALVPLLPLGSALHVFTLEAWISDAFNKGWLTRWEKEGFKGRPSWQQLMEVCKLTNVRLSVIRPPEVSSHYSLLKELASETRPFREPKQRKWNPYARTEADRLMARAIERDKDP